VCRQNFNLHLVINNLVLTILLFHLIHTYNQEGKGAYIQSSNLSSFDHKLLPVPVALGQGYWSLLFSKFVLPVFQICRYNTVSGR